MKPRRLPRVGDVWERAACNYWLSFVRVVVTGTCLGGSFAAEESVEIVTPGSDGQRPMRSRPRLDTFLKAYSFVSGAR